MVKFARIATQPVVVLSAVAVGVAALGGLAVVFNGESGRSAGSTFAPPSTSIVAPLGSSTTRPPDSGTVAPAPTIEQPSSDGAKEVESPGVLSAPTPGTYHYRSETNDETYPFEVSAVSDGDGRTVRDVRFGESSLVERHVWTESHHEIAGFSTGGSDRAPPQTCDFEPPIIFLRLPLAEGDSWETTSRCTIESGSSTTTVDRVDAVTVIGPGVEAVAGQEVPVWRIQVESRSTFVGSFNNGAPANPGAMSSTYRRDSVFSYSLEHGLAIREKYRMQTDAAVGAQSFEDELSLLDLAPT